MNNAIYDLIRPHFHTLSGYISAGMSSDKATNLTFMNANENPYELPGLEGLNRYPEPQNAKLKQAYANTYGVSPNQVFMSRGSDESIAMLTKIFCEPNKDAILISTPTFGIYAVDALAMPANVVDVPLIKSGNTYTLDTDNIIKTAQEDNSIKMLYVCSPNNPTGTSFPREDILRIASETESHAIVILDEAYTEFSDNKSLTTELENHPNLIILRTLSKAYALAGARMGACLCADTDFISFMMEKASDIYPLPIPSIKAAISALSMQDQMNENVNKILDERERIIRILNSSSHVTRVYDSDTNFLLVEMKEPKEFHALCTNNNLILRDFSNAKGSENCIRITIGTLAQNDALLKLLEEF